MKLTREMFVVAALCTATLLTMPVRAGEITGFSWSSGIASVALDPVAPPVAVNNDNVVGISPNQILVTQKDYIAIGPVDIVFDVRDTGGVTEYAFAEGVNNSTGIDWSGYRMELGFGTGAGFTLSLPTDDLDFDSPDFDSPLSFSSFFPDPVSASTDVLVGTGGIHPNFAFTTPLHVFSIDVPDGISSFTLRQIPIAVPEPASVGLLLAGLAGVMLRGRRPAA